MENGYLEETLERLAAATVQLERTIAGMEERHAHVCGEVEKIVATAEGHESSRLELERKLAAAEQKIVALLGQADAHATGIVRRTVSAVAAPMVSKGGLQTGGHLDTGTLDAALFGLSLEQRIAVKSQLLRAGVCG